MIAGVAVFVTDGCSSLLPGLSFMTLVALAIASTPDKARTIPTKSFQFYQNPPSSGLRLCNASPIAVQDRRCSERIDVARPSSSPDNHCRKFVFSRLTPSIQGILRHSPGHSITSIGIAKKSPENRTGDIGEDLRTSWASGIRPNSLGRLVPGKFSRSSAST